MSADVTKRSRVAAKYLFAGAVLASFGLVLFGSIWTAVRFAGLFDEFFWTQGAYDEAHYFWQLYGQLAGGGLDIDYRLFSKLLAAVFLSIGASFDQIVTIYAIVNPILALAGALLLASIWEKRSVGRVVWALLLVLSFDLLSGSSRVVDYNPPAGWLERLVGDPGLLKADVTSFFMIHRRPEPQSSWVVFFPYAAALLSSFLHGRRGLYLGVCAATPLLVIIYINISVVALLVFVQLSLCSLLIYRRPVAVPFALSLLATLLLYGLSLVVGSTSAIVAQTTIHTHMPILRPSIAIAIAGLVWSVLRVRREGVSPRPLAAAVFFGVPLITLNQQLATGIAVMPQNWEYYINYICLVIGAGVMSADFLSSFEKRGGWRQFIPLGLLALIGFVVIQGEMRNEIYWSRENVQSVLFAKVLAKAKAKVERIDAVVLPHLFDEPLFVTRVPRGTVVLGGYEWFILNPPPVWRDEESLEKHAETARTSFSIGFETLFRSGVTPSQLQNNMQSELATGDCWLGLGYFFSLNDCWPAFLNYTSPGTRRLASAVSPIVEMYRRYLERDALRDLVRRQVLLIRIAPLSEAIDSIIDNELVASAEINERGTLFRAYAYIQRPR